MSSVTTSVPVGPVKEWCLGRQVDFDGERYKCGNTTRGLLPEDFQSFCCNGEILSTKWSIWSQEWPDDPSLPINDLICCGLSGPQVGGLQALPTAYTECSAGAPTPLASIANTNVDNAQPFLVTYKSASFGGPTPGDYIPTETPSCFWAYTKDAQKTEVVLPAPLITTLPPATDEFGNPVVIVTHTPTSETSEPTSTGPDPTSSSTSSGTRSAQTTASASTSANSQAGTATVTVIPSTETPASAAADRSTSKRGLLQLSIGLVALSMLWGPE